MLEESATKNPGHGPVHHRTLYLPDGDIILSVANERGPTLLRLHRVMLSHFSPIFRDMFSIPSNPQVNDIYEGVPVVVMPDPHESLVDLIQALYSPEALGLEKQRTINVEKVRGILALSKKYQVDSVSTRIARRIEADWPTTLHEHCVARKAFESQVDYIESEEYWERVEHDFPEPASAIRLAMESDIRSILPAAFYRLAISDASADWEDLDLSNYEMDMLSARWKLLEKEDWVRYNRGKDALSNVFESLSLYGREVRSTLCQTKDDCETAMEDLRRRHRLRCTARFARQPDVLDGMMKLREAVWEVGLCTYCAEHMTKFFTKSMKQTWNELPEIFDLVDEA